MITISLNEIISYNPSAYLFLDVMHKIGKINKPELSKIKNALKWSSLARDLPKDIIDKSDDIQSPMMFMLDEENIEDGQWLLHVRWDRIDLWIKYAVWCVRNIEHLIDDERSKKMLYVAWEFSEGKRSYDELEVAKFNARDALNDFDRSEEILGYNNMRRAKHHAYLAAAVLCSSSHDAGARRIADYSREAAAFSTGEGRNNKEKWQEERKKQHEKLIQILEAGKWVE